MSGPRPVRVRALLIGIGSGVPEQLTGQAVAALHEVDVFLVADKGGDKHDLVRLRADLCAAVIGPGRTYRFVEVTDPERGPDRDRNARDYRQGVLDWHAARAARYADVIRREVPDQGTVGFLVWGDPALYDSTLRIIDSVGGFGVDAEVTVIPGVSSIQLLAAAHRIALNRIGQPIHITTGRRLLGEYSPDLGDVVVMLDGDLACRGLVERFGEVTIFWGAQLGLPEQALISGPLAAVIAEIEQRRAEIRADRGWVMDTYLLRPPG